MTLSEILNENGYLREPSLWSAEVARQIARREGLENLDNMHWEIIRFLRKHYAEFDYLPTLRRTCKVSGDWSESCLSCFFRDDPLKAVKIAGIPEPTDDLKAYYRGVCKCKRPSTPVFENRV